MAEDLIIPKTESKEELYKSLIPQIEALTADEPDLIANLSNICAVLKEAFGFLWIGFYLVKGNQLVLGPFQGPVACTRINKGKGVCGTVWETKKAIIVDDVDSFPGHIACSSLSKSEIVIPVINDGEVTMVLDIDSENPADFDNIDRIYLTKIVDLI